MGTMYKIRCRHCGTQFVQNVNNISGIAALCAGSDCHIETEVAMRCPTCMKRLNTTEQEFRRQVETVMVWN